MAEVIRMDAEGRVAIPAALRERVGLREGAVAILDEEDGVVVLRLSADPFDVLASHAIEEYRAGRTTSLRDYLAERDAAVGGE